MRMTQKDTDTNKHIKKQRTDGQSDKDSMRDTKSKKTQDIWKLVSSIN